MQNLVIWWLALPADIQFLTKAFCFAFIFLFILFPLKNYFARAHVLWEDKHKQVIEVRKKKIEMKQAEKGSAVGPNNKYMNEIISKARIVLFNGTQGSGKTITMNGFTKWMYDKQQLQLRKQKRMLHFLNPEILFMHQKIVDQELLSIHSNIPFLLDKLKTQDNVVQVLSQLEKAVQRAILVFDELGDLFPKTKWNELNSRNANPEEVERMKAIVEFARYIRHYIDGYLFATEQDKENFYIGIRRFGYASVTCEKTWHPFGKFGRALRFVFNFINTWLPGWLVGRPLLAMRAELSVPRKIIRAITLILPNWFNGLIYYTSKTKYNTKIKKRFTSHKVLTEFEGKKQFLVFKHNQIFDYDTRNRAGDYQERFEKNGTRKKYI